MVGFEYIDYIANLAKLDFTEGEKKELKIYMENILSYVEILNEVNIDNTPMLEENRVGIEALRDDEVIPSFNRESIIENAPSKKSGFFSVP